MSLEIGKGIFFDRDDRSGQAGQTVVELLQETTEDKTQTNPQPATKGDAVAVGHDWYVVKGPIFVNGIKIA